MHSSWNGSCVHAGGHELEKSHLDITSVHMFGLVTYDEDYLRGCILTSNPLLNRSNVTSVLGIQVGWTHIWSESEVADTSFDILAVSVVKMSIQNLFRERQWSSQSNESKMNQRLCIVRSYIPVADNGKIVLNSLVVNVCAFFEQRHGHFRISNARYSCGHACGKPLQRPHGIGGSA
jgi:hypothetical protein